MGGNQAFHLSAAAYVGNHGCPRKYPFIQGQQLRGNFQVKLVACMIIGGKYLAADSSPRRLHVRRGVGVGEVPPGVGGSWHEFPEFDPRGGLLTWQI
jgi:hypothetical protein